MHNGKFAYRAGGVARNICEALCKLSFAPNFITVLGNDEQGKLLRSFIPEESQGNIKSLDIYNTAQCIVVFDEGGDCTFLMGDMEIHEAISPQMIKDHEEQLRTAPLIILDGNLTIDTLEAILSLATLHNVPVLYEPTDLEISIKPFQTKSWKAIKFITPNLNELKFIASHFSIKPDGTESNNIEEAANIASKLVQFVDNIIVTLGSNGLLVARKGSAHEPFLLKSDQKEVHVRHYPGIKKESVVNVSGAGDCLASGIISGILSGLNEEMCVSRGIGAAHGALYSLSAVPSSFKTKDNLWSVPAPYKTIKKYEF